MAAMKERALFQCSICKVELTSRQSLKEHSNIHKGIVFECQDCTKKILYITGSNKIFMGGITNKNSISPNSCHNLLGD